MSDDAMRVRLGEYTWPEVRDLLARDPVVIVPVGAFEQHGHHLPLAVDAMTAGAMAEAGAEAANAEGACVVVTPTLWTGYSPHHRDFPGTITLDDEVFGKLVEQVSLSLHGAGFRRILVLNGHGGNMALLRNAVQALRYRHGVRISTASYWDFAVPQITEWRRSPPGGIMHACEMETALMLAQRPDLVRMDKAEDVFLKRSRWGMADLTSGSIVTSAASFAELTPSGVIGAPTLATEERGHDLTARIVAALAEFLVDFAAWTLPPEEKETR